MIACSSKYYSGFDGLDFRCTAVSESGNGDNRKMLCAI